jgi:hypothetical protein
VGVSSVSFYVDGALLGTDTSAPYSMTWGTVAAANGGHTLSVVAKVAAGNSGNTSASVIVNNQAPPPPPPGDTTPPTIAILSPGNGATISGSVGVSVNSYDAVGVVRVELYIDGSLTDSSTSAPFTTAWNSRPKKISDGAHALQVRTYDAAGNVGAASITVYK